MCGLILCWDQNITYNEIERAASTMSHRGERTTYSDLTAYGAGIAAHVRLPILGLSDAYDQPIRELNAEGYQQQVYMVGEYYEYNGLAYENDTLQVAKYLLNRPFDDIEQLPGMYHVVRVVNGTIAIVMDHLGKKPLYYRKDKKAIASEIKALTSLGPCTIDAEYMQDLRDGNIPWYGSTPYNEIKRLNSHYKYYFDSHGREVTSVIASPSIIRSSQSSASTQMLKSYIERAVVERWVSSDRPVGLLVSGGLDSSIIYYVLRNWLGFDTIKRIPIFHIENNESEYLAYLDHNPEKIYRLKYGTGIDLADVLYYAESPMDRGSLLPQYLLSKAIGRIGIRVVLSGDGADELFCGYRRCQEKDTRNFDLRELRIWHLPRLDKMMMANTIELRCPFLADNIIGHITRYTWREIANKVPLKEIAKDIGVPDEIINREKKPLKSPESASNKISWQNFLVSEFIKHYPTGLHNEH